MEKAGQFKGLDPNRHYVAVYKAAIEGGIGEYEDMGYIVETARPDGPRSISQRKERGMNEPIEYRGHVLMSIALEEKQAMEAGAQAEADAVERRIIRRDGMKDLMRGISGVRGRSGNPTLGVENETEALQQELV